MLRKEVYATTGTRLRVRVFGGFDFSEADMDRSDFARHGYARGVPMGGDLKAAPQGQAPTFLIRALRDPDGANLDRAQVIKGWLDRDGYAQEKVYNVAWSGERKLGADGSIPVVGNTVDPARATWTDSIGAAQISTVWEDPDFNRSVPAFYSVRVLEVPTPRWSAYDAVRFDVDLPAGARSSTQERAYTSAIWYYPD